MKKKLLKLMLFLLFPMIINAQSNMIVWEKSYGGSKSDNAYSVEQTADSGYIVAGLTYSDDGDVHGFHGNLYPDCWIIRLNKKGDTLWTKSLGGTAEDWVDQIKQTQDGGFIVAASSFSNNGDVHDHHGSTFYSDVWLIRLDSLGDTLWTKSYGGTLNEFNASIDLTDDGGFILGASAESTDGDVWGNIGGMDFWVLRLDSNGDTIWTRSYGGTGTEQINSIKTTNDGGFIAVGYTWSTDVDVTGNHGFQDLWVLKLDSAGNIMWQNALGGSGRDFGNSIDQDLDGNYVIAGYVYQYAGSGDGDVSGYQGDKDYWIIKLDSVGDTIWTKTLGGSNLDRSQSIINTCEGGYIVAGYSRSNDGDVLGHHGSTDSTDFWIVKLDAQANIKWQHSLGGIRPDDAYGITQTFDGYYIIVGSNASTDGDASVNKGAYDFWVVKMMSNQDTAKICVVTVDSATQKNLVVWEKPAVNNIASYNIYKETFVANEYSLIGNVPFDSLSIFPDNASDPKVKATRYKISTVDNCGYESLLSDSNKTIHLAINLGIPPAINLIIDGYEGFNFPTYYIWGGNAGGMNIIDTINSTLTQYTVLNPGPADSLFFLELLHPTGCNPTLAKVLTYNSARSNVSNRLLPTGINKFQVQSLKFKVYPNPYTGVTQIGYTLTEKANVTLEVLNVLGKKVKTIVNKVQHAGKYQYKFAGSETENSSGIFILKLIVNDNVYTKQLVNL